MGESEKEKGDYRSGEPAVAEGSGLCKRNFRSKLVSVLTNDLPQLRNFISGNHHLFPWMVGDHNRRFTNSRN